jgi:hypothetical protein
LQDCWASETSWSAERRGFGTEVRRPRWVGLPDRGPGPEDAPGGAKEAEAKLIRVVFSPFPVPWLPWRLREFWDWAPKPTWRRC